MGRLALKLSSPSLLRSHPRVRLALFVVPASCHSSFVTDIFFCPTPSVLASQIPLILEDGSFRMQLFSRILPRIKSHSPNSWLEITHSPPTYIVAVLLLTSLPQKCTKGNENTLFHFAVWHEVPQIHFFVLTREIYTFPFLFLCACTNNYINAFRV